MMQRARRRINNTKDDNVIEQTCTLQSHMFGWSFVGRSLSLLLLLVHVLVGFFSQKDVVFVHSFQQFRQLQQLQQLQLQPQLQLQKRRHHQHVTIVRNTFKTKRKESKTDLSLLFSSSFSCSSSNKSPKYLQQPQQFRQSHHYVKNGWNKISLPLLLSSASASLSIEQPQQQQTSIIDDCSNDGAIAMNLQQLSIVLGGGIGRAQLVWDCYKLGIDPDWYYSYNRSSDININSKEDNDLYDSIQKQLPSMRRNQKLGIDGLRLLSNTYNKYAQSNKYNHDNDNCITTIGRSLRLQGDVATLVDISVSESTTPSNDNDEDGIDLTTKLLIKLSLDGLLVETVIIPWKGIRSTVCISSQVGCKQACQFCATGKMGKIRSLSASEILIQMFYAQQIVRQTNRTLPPITNVVFMGMGEPADNADNVNKAIEILTDRKLYQLSSNRVTVSTVAPTPQSFDLFVNASCVLAWSVHAVRDDLRKLLVPTTKYTMKEIRQGFINTLNSRKQKTTMIEVVLIDHINDNIQEATELAEFCHGILDAVPGCKLFVNLIPYNEISIPTTSSSSSSITNNNNNNVFQQGVPLPSIGGGNSSTSIGSSTTGTSSQYKSYFSFRKPSMERVRAFQQHLWTLGIFAPVRTPRGDDEAAACGQLVTNNKHGTQQQQQKITINEKE